MIVRHELPGEHRTNVLKVTFSAMLEMNGRIVTGRLQGSYEDDSRKGAPRPCMCAAERLRRSADRHGADSEGGTLLQLSKAFKQTKGLP